MIFGRLLGVVFGYMLGSWLGAAIGFWLGSKMDQQVQSMPNAATRVKTQSTFFSATFSVMGYLCKADGRVSEHEIQMARSIMQQMQLNADQMKQAQGFFSQGKASGFVLEPVLQQLRQECRFQPALLRNFLEIQCLSAYADGHVDPEERRILEEICTQLGVPRGEFSRIEAAIKAHIHANSAQSQGLSIDDAYAIIGVSENDSNAVVKKAYRRLMNQHHPDKLVSKGLPEEMMRLAVEKSQEIQKAYEIIQKSRKG